VDRAFPPESKTRTIEMVHAIERAMHDHIESVTWMTPATKEQAIVKDRSEWTMTPPTINACYSSQLNTINFSAGILQPPYFEKNMDDSVNYGAIGMIIGHELTHGFDAQGRKFDAQGNLRDWWTAEDAKHYDERGKCIADEYTQEVPVAGPGVKQNGC
jgi:putative endopeptidase